MLATLPTIVFYQDTLKNSFATHPITFWPLHSQKGCHPTWKNVCHYTQNFLSPHPLTFLAIPPPKTLPSYLKHFPAHSQIFFPHHPLKFLVISPPQKMLLPHPKNICHQSPNFFWNHIPQKSFPTSPPKHFAILPKTCFYPTPNNFAT